MAFRRIALPSFSADSNTLTSCLVGIGMNLAAPSARNPNIEDTILFASLEGIEKDDFRVLALLVTWFGIHAAWVNADRLTSLVSAQSSTRVRAFWSALAAWQKADRRFARVAALYSGPRLDLIKVGIDFHLTRYGEDQRFEGGKIRVPANILRDRPLDVLAPSLLARRHRDYYYRIMMGPNYLADMWSRLEDDPTLSAAALARKTYGSFATAWHVRRDFLILQAASIRNLHPPESKKKPAASMSRAHRTKR